MAAQLSLMNGPPARLEWSWMARATSSLPVPFSPVMSTRPLVGAVLLILSKMARMAGLEPIMAKSPPAAAVRRWFSRRSPA